MPTEEFPLYTQPCLICSQTSWKNVFKYSEAPARETRFSFTQNKPYRRTVDQCQVCGHFVSHHTMGSEVHYDADYVTATYAGQKGVEATFERIMALPASASDNAGRVKRIADYAAQEFGTTDFSQHSVLDVGSGLAVFPAAMKRGGWQVSCVDPDPRNVAHARDYVGVTAYHADFAKFETEARFDVISLNKVLEHVPAPIDFLAHTKRFLKPGGFVYLEVPDGEIAAYDGIERQEFFIDHGHVFGAVSFALTIRSAGYTISELKRLQDPSKKYTLFAFCELR